MSFDRNERDVQLLEQRKKQKQNKNQMHGKITLMFNDAAALVQ